MNYEDFPILTNEQYHFLNEHYETKSFNKKQIIQEICNQLNGLIYFSNLDNIYNSKIQTSIKEAKLKLTENIDTIESLFNLKPTDKTEFIQHSVFSFLSRLSKILKQTNDWILNEDKTYYQKTATNLNNKICECIDLICNSLENSNITFYKHM